MSRYGVIAAGRLLLHRLATGTVNGRVMSLLRQFRETLVGLGSAMLQPVRFRLAFAIRALPRFARLPQIDDITHDEHLSRESPGR